MLRLLPTWGDTRLMCHMMHGVLGTHRHARIQTMACVIIQAGDHTYGQADRDRAWPQVSDLAGTAVHPSTREPRMAHGRDCVGRHLPDLTGLGAC